MYFFRPFKVFYFNFIKNRFKLKKSVQIDVTSLCNLKCRGCYHFSDKKHFDQSLKGWEKVFREYKAAGIYNIWLYGGEPTLRMDIIECAQNYFPLVYVITNGQIPINKKYRNIRIYVSLDGLAEYHDYYRGQGSFDKISKNYVNDKRVVFNVTLTKGNVEQIASLIDYMLSMKVHGIGFQFFSKTDGGDFVKSDYSLTETDYLKCGEMLSKYYNNSKVFFSEKLFKAMKNLEMKEENCFIRNYIDCYYSDGTRKKCCTPGVSCKSCRILPPYFHYVIDKYHDIPTYIKFLKWL